MGIKQLNTELIAIASWFVQYKVPTRVMENSYFYFTDTITILSQF